MQKQFKTAIVWGDSVARGVLYDESRKRYSLSSETAVGVIGDGLGIEVRNRSRMGATSTDGIRMMNKDLENGLLADVAVIEFGGNDCDFDWQAVSDAPNEIHLPKTVDEAFEKNINCMVSTARKAGMEPILVNLLPINAERYFDFISSGTRSAEHILHWLGDKFQIYRYQERYSMMIDRIARETGCKLIDARSAFLNVWDSTTRLYCPDGIHPTAEGQTVLGKQLLKNMI